MITGLYSAASGMLVQERVQDLLAQNLAGSQMPGFQREEAVIRSFPDVMLSETYRGISPSTNKPRYNQAIGRIGTGAGIDWIYVNYQPGSFTYTGNPTDLAINGDGFFTVNTPDGMRFTRSGDFLVDSEGYLANSQGFRVLGQGVNQGRKPSPIRVGMEDFYVDPFGQVFTRRLDPNTNVVSDVLVDQIKIVDFDNRDKLFREAGNLYRLEEGDQNNLKIPDKFQVAQGYFERSNTIPTTDMVKLIDSYRVHEASARVIRAIDQTLQRAVNDVART